MSTVEDAHTVPPITGISSEVHRPRRQRRGLILSLGSVLIASGVGAWIWSGRAATDSPRAAAGPVATAKVVRGSITATDTWDGTLGYGKPFTVTSMARGVITRLAEQGTVLKRGDELYRVDERPVILFYGAVPMYRDLEPGSSGADVKQLESNLAALGYKGIPVDGRYTSSTADAVRRWQAQTGAEPTGAVSRASVVFRPGGGRVDDGRADVGSLIGPGTPVLDITGTEQIVTLEAELGDRNRFDVGTKVTIVLPGGGEVTGRVTSLAVVTKIAAGDSRADPGATTPESIAQVEVLLEKKVANDLVGSSVDVVVAIDERRDVLLVPVNALLALSEGGYGLEVVRDDGATSIVAVKTGLFADGRVQVEGDGISEGTVVGVAGR